MRYKVYARSVTYCYLIVEADDEDEAWNIARDTDGGEWETDCCHNNIDGFWEMYDIEEDE